MRSIQGNMLQSLRAVEDFLDGNADKLAGVVNSGTRRKLTETIDALEVHVAEQAGNQLAAQGATQKHRVLRLALVRDHMTPIARIADADLPPTPEIDALRPPRASWSIERLAAAANGMAKAAAPFSADFVRAGLPADFIARLTGAADALVQAVADRAQSRGRTSGATKGLKTTLAAGTKLVRVIDAFVVSALADDPALLANWKRVKKVQKIGVRSADAVLPTTVPAPAVVAGR